MNEARWQEIKSAFGAALKLEPSLRCAFVEDIGSSDPDLRRRVEFLLMEHEDESDEFLLTPAVDLDIYKGLLDIDSDSSVGKRIGPYKLVQVLGSGGMGDVYLAKRDDAQFDQRVAIKLIRSGQESIAVVSRFKAERQILAGLDHPNIAKLLDGGRTPQGQPYFVMEYVAGVPVTDYCDEKKLKIRERLELFIQVCEGVQYAHQNAIIHRDLKPSNILVVEIDGKPVPRIIDFGLAKTTSAASADQTQLTKFGIFMGTPGFMSPEQAELGVRNVDTRTDVYSLGALLCVLLTGLHPFETVERRLLPLDEWLGQLREEDPPVLSSKVSSNRVTINSIAKARGTAPNTLAKQLRGDLDWIAMRALERDRARRYGAPSELAADLRRYLNDEPVLAHAASAAYQSMKFVRRHRVVAGYMAIVTVLLIAASAAALVAARQKQEAQFQATQALESQSRLLTQAATQRLRDGDVPGAQSIALEVLTNPSFAQARTPAAISVFQDIRAADAQLAILSGHLDFVHSAAYSPDGTRVVTASYDRTVGIWDARSGLRLASLSGHRDRVYSAVYSPDGTRIVTASADKTARVWDARTGAQLAVLSGHGDRVWSAAYSPDGNRIVTASHDKTARIWDAHTGAQLAVLSGHGDRVTSAGYSPDGARIVTASFDDTARIWDARSGVQLITLSGPGDRLESAEYSPDGTRVVTASMDKTARIWDARTGAQLAVLSGHLNWVLHAAYSPDGARIVTASADGTARIWDARTGAQLNILAGHDPVVATAAYSPDASHIVTASFDGTARTWNARADPQFPVLSGHSNIVESEAFSPDGTRIVTASADKTARIWDAHTGAQLAILSGHGDVIATAAFSPDGSRIVTASGDKTARIWDANTGAQLLLLSGHSDRVASAAYSPDGAHIVTASADKTARIWDAHTGAQQLSIQSGEGGALESAVYSPDGVRILTASIDKTARIWDARSGAQLVVLSGHSGWVLSAAYSPDGTRIVTASVDKTARIWDAHTGAQFAMLTGHSDIVETAAFSPDGSRIVTASYDKTARIWDALTGAQLAVLSGHGDRLISAAYSPDAARIVTASADRTARIWDANVPASLEGQIAWGLSGETKFLGDIDRAELGVPPDLKVRTWAIKASACDHTAAAPYDPDRVTAGVTQKQIAIDVASLACSAEINTTGHPARADYQMGRVLLAKGDVTGAKREFEIAASRGYRAADVDLANLLQNAPEVRFDPARLITIYESAWAAGVPIAAYSLGHLYEMGMTNSTNGKLQPGLEKAWSWYQRGADAGEPTALARFAERSETNALAEADPVKSNALLFRAFSYYAAAAERAKNEDWPDDAWVHWRYRRATLARLLAREGMMQRVADAFTAIRSQKVRSSKFGLTNP